MTLLIFICVAIAVIFVVLEKFKYLIIFTVSSLTLYLLYRLFKERKSMKRVQETSFLQLCLVLFKQIDCYKKIVLKEKNLILISEYGIFYFYFINEHGVITGNKKEQTLSIKYNNVISKIPNYFYNYDAKVNELEKLCGREINGFAITANDCDIVVELPFKVSKYRLFVNDFKKTCKKKVLTVQEIESIYMLFKK